MGNSTSPRSKAAQEHVESMQLIQCQKCKTKQPYHHGLRIQHCALCSHPFKNGQTITLKPAYPQEYISRFNTLKAMGFTEAESIAALKSGGGDIATAVNQLIESQNKAIEPNKADESKQEKKISYDMDDDEDIDIEHNNNNNHNHNNKNNHNHNNNNDMPHYRGLVLPGSASSTPAQSPVDLFLERCRKGYHCLNCDTYYVSKWSAVQCGCHPFNMYCACGCDRIYHGQDAFRKPHKTEPQQQGNE